MQTISSNQLLDSLQAQTESFLNEAVQTWQMMSQEQLSLQPSPTQWSAKQCLAHLNSYGDYYLPAIETAIQRAKSSGSMPNPHFTAGWLGNYFTKMMQPDSNGMPVKKMKAFKSYVHTNDEEGYKIVATFIDQQERMLAIIEAARRINISKTKVGISIAPYIHLKLGDVLMFITAHNLRHLKQAARAAETGIAALHVFA